MSPAFHRFRRFTPLFPVAGALLFLLVSFALNPWDHYISFTNDFHVGIWGRAPDACIVFFNDAEYGPYRGSIISMVPAEYPAATGFGATMGIYYRHFQWRDAKLWTLMISLWYLVGFGALMSAVWYAWRRVGRRRATCPKEANI